MKRFFLILTILILSICGQEADAFWGKGGNETASGLNVDTGFDINTITTMAGVVATPPEGAGSRSPALLSMTTAQGMVKVILGPWWYWEQQNIVISKDQELSVTGSLAQGKDGSFYLFAQRIENRSDGKTLTLRSENGVPLWSRNGSENHGGMGRQGGMNQPARSGGQGGGMRGGRR